MLESLQAQGLLTVIEIIGPILLGAALIYGIMRSRRRGQTAQADSATRRVYADEEQRRDVKELT